MGKGLSQGVTGPRGPLGLREALSTLLTTAVFVYCSHKEPTRPTYTGPEAPPRFHSASCDLNN